MPDPTDKRTALIEALGHAICIADLKERIAATVDAIVAIVDERVAELRAIEAEGGETTAIRHCLGPGCKGDGCCFCACDACEPEDEPRNDDACRVKMDQARAGTKCARGTVGCIAHSPPDEDAPSEEDEGSEVWVEIDRHGKPAQVNDHKPGHGWEHDPNGRAVRYVPASRLQAAERRIAELESRLADETRRNDANAGALGLENAGLRARMVEMEARAADERRIANEHLAARHDAEKRIAELGAERDAAMTLLRHIRPADNEGRVEITYDGPSLRRSIDRALRGQMPETETETDEC